MPHVESEGTGAPAGGQTLKGAGKAAAARARTGKGDDEMADERNDDALRDDFAKAALVGLLAEHLFLDDNALALRSYHLAEQMLRVRRENAEGRKAERKAAR